MKRTKVIEIVAARDIVFALAHSGVCAAFSRGNYRNLTTYSQLCVYVTDSMIYLKLQSRTKEYAF
jgi:hypothetical protein